MPWKKLCLSLAVALVTLLAGEGAYRVALGARGRPYGRVDAQEKIAALREATSDFAGDGGERDGEPDRGRASERKTNHVVHPFTAFATQRWADNLARQLQIQERQPDELRILLLGGSVAAAFAESSAPRLGELLSADPRLAGREVRFLRGGTPAFKQPQQLLRLVYLFSMGIEVDLVVSIDGFNELAIGMTNLQAGAHPCHPAHSEWVTLLVDSTADPSAMLRLGRIQLAREELLASLEDAEASPLLFSAVAGRWLLKRSAAQHDEILVETQAYVDALNERELPAHVSGPPFEGGPLAALDEAVRCWSESTRMAASLCDARGVTYVAVMQPALLDEGSKVPTAGELADARSNEGWTFGARRGYPLLREAGERLRAEGVAVVDATRLFADVEERVFQDAVHLNRPGYLILAEAIAAGVLAALPE